MRRLLIVVLGFIAISSIEAQVTTTHGKWKLVHARATQTPQAVSIKILEPISGQVIDGSDLAVKISVENWNVRPKANHLHLMLDNEPIQEHYSQEPFIFRNVSPGPHVIRVFPVYSWHESVKQQSALAIVQFFVKEKTGSLPVDWNKPMMIYSTPAGTHRATEKLPGQPHAGILIDWFLHNVTMGTKTGYLVQISVDGKTLTSMKEWRPHYIQDLEPGEHKIKLELLKQGAPVQGSWNVIERTIVVSSE